MTQKDLRKANDSGQCLKLFTPVVGEVYKNHEGRVYLCLWTDVRGTAKMLNLWSGWMFYAHSCRKLENGTIEWDYSSGGYFCGAEERSSDERALCK